MQLFLCSTDVLLVFYGALLYVLYSCLPGTCPEEGGEEGRGTEDISLRNDRHHNFCSAFNLLWLSTSVPSAI